MIRPATRVEQPTGGVRVRGIDLVACSEAEVGHLEAICLLGTALRQSREPDHSLPSESSQNSLTHSLTHPSHALLETADLFTPLSSSQVS